MPAPDWRRAQRGEKWEPCSHTVAVPVASGETINHGDLVELNTSGQATRVTGSAGGIPTVTAIYGIAVGRSDVVAEDPDLYPRLQVKPLTANPRVVLRFLTSAGAPATPSRSDIGASITLRMGASGGAVAGVLGCNRRTGSDAIHGIIEDVVDDKFVLVKLDDDIIAGG